jgi:hypothetical protein
MRGALPWLAAFAQQRGLRYEPDADERWLRAWEPYATVRVPFRYEHALHATGEGGSMSIARAVLEVASSSPGEPPTEVGTWLAIVQDERIRKRAATTCDFGSAFAESLDLVTLPRRPTGDRAFDHVFASFAESDLVLADTITPSVRRLLLSWRIPVHAETRPGGFILVPVALGADERGLAWLLEALPLFGRKATKHRT